MIYLVGGKARSGKDTFCEYLKEELISSGKKVCVMQLSMYLKVLIREYLGWDGKDETKPRSLLQELGTDIIREKMGMKYFFTNRLVDDIKIMSNYFDTFIVSDVRLPLEYEEVCKEFDDVVKIKVIRDMDSDELSDKEKKHITETALDNYNEVDYKILNTTLDDLREKAIVVANGGSL